MWVPHQQPGSSPVLEEVVQDIGTLTRGHGFPSLKPLDPSTSREQAHTESSHGLS